MDIKYEHVTQECREEADRLLEKYFPDYVGDTLIHRTELLDPMYNDDLPHQIEKEFRAWLRNKWNSCHPDNPDGFKKVMNLTGALGTVDNSYIPHLEDKGQAARIVNLWERIVHTNHKDVDRYVRLLKQYTKELLNIMIMDFWV